MTPDTALKALRNLVAKDQICTKLSSFARGLDGRNSSLAMEAFHGGAVDIHPPMGTWSVEEMPEKLAVVFDSMFTESQYFMAFPHIEIDGDAAKSETYVWCAKRTLDVDPHGFSYLRLSGMVYFDAWELREDEWGIVRRRFVPAWELFHSIGAEDSSIERHYKPVTTHGTEQHDSELDYRDVASEFWGRNA